MNNTLSLSRPAILLALKISGSILALLIIILGIFYILALAEGEKDIQRNLMQRWQEIRQRPNILRNIDSGERVPPFARNIIIERDGNFIATGMFRNTDIDFRLFRPLPIGVIYRTSYENIPIVVLPIMVGDARVYLYDSEGGIDRLKETFFFWGLISIGIFSLFLFILSTRIASLTLAPIEASYTRSLSYNRYLAHELKTPLTIIQNQLELASKMKSYDSALLSSSLEEVDHMKQTIDGLLLISEAERSLQKRASLVAPLVSEIEKELFPLMQEKNISLSLTGEVNISVLAEPLLLHTCIRNLLENAVKYSSSPGKITVEIRKGRLYINNTVDTGLSMDTTRIFDEFVGTPGSGNGLWLAIVKKIVDVHGWKISFKRTSVSEVQVKISF